MSKEKKNTEPRVRFISYDGRYPNLCSGTLVLSIDGEAVTFPPYCMSSGGGVYFGDDDDMEYGPWGVEVPEKYNDLLEEIEECVNANVPFGCCGGCI